MNPLLMIIVGLIFAVIIAFFVILMIPTSYIYQFHVTEHSGIVEYSNMSMPFHHILSMNYSKDNITYYTGISIANMTEGFIAAGPEVSSIHANNNICFVISPQYICTNSGNSKISFNVSIHVYSNNCFVNINMPSCGKYYNICSISESMVGNQISLSITIKLNNLQKDSLLIIPISVNSCTKCFQIYIK